MRTLARLTALGVALPLAALGAGGAGATVPADRPQLRPYLPTDVRADQTAPAYVDAFAKPGRLVYRFDTVIENLGGALDLFRDPGSGHVFQVIWPGGRPSSQPDPLAAPADPRASLEDLTPRGASIHYETSDGHEHFHFDGAARYELLGPDGATRASDKVGFCMEDTWGRGRYFAESLRPDGSDRWCREREPDAQLVRMGISPARGDYYWSQLSNQWIDVTGLAPGAYTLRATVNPYGYLDESDTSDDVLTQTRTIPGVAASGASVSTSAGRAVSVALQATVVGAEVPARASAGCVVDRRSTACLVRVDGRPPSFRVSAQPAHGTVSLAGSTATYTPAAGFSGTDTFSFVATDVRGLSSAPATVAVAVGGGPANDMFAEARRLDGASGAVTGSSVGATKEPGEPAHAGGAGGRSVWFSWTAPASGTATLDTVGSAFDTTLAVYTGSSVAALTPVAANDDIVDYREQQSRVAFAAAAGRTYRVAVDGWDGDAGPVTLHWSLAPDAPPPPAAGPANDMFAAAQPLPGDAGSAAGSSAQATREPGEPAHAGNAGGRSVWFSWTPSASGTATVDTVGSAFDTTLAVYTGSSLSSLTPVAANDDIVTYREQQSRVGFAAAAGTTYRVAVDGWDGAGGAVALHWSLAAQPQPQPQPAGPANDMLAAASPLAGASGSVAGSSERATKEPGEPAHAGDAGGRSVWFSWTAPASGTATFETVGSSFDTLLGVYTGASVGALALVAENDDIVDYRERQSRVGFAAEAGRTYLVAVDGWGGAGGAVTLSWSLR